MLRYLPNLLSSLRLLAAPFAAWLILSAHDTAALAVFAGAGTSDALDGFIARHWGVTSRFGARLDPAADKLLMVLCFAALYGVDATPLWLVLLVIGRDLAIAAGWLFVKAVALPVRTEPMRIGKLTTAIQIGYIGAMLVLLAFDLKWPRGITAAAYVTGFVTFLSAIAYAYLLLRGLFAGRRTA
ncbi:MAG TPA: CDP-alcohol phosphatidyltransferase family protein [Rhizomicrobium sp.]|nr:CDP-alcohol phosphatidyltransferase family protein [Rhizomicrobium sp.]